MSRCDEYPEECEDCKKNTCKAHCAECGRKLHRNAKSLICDKCWQEVQVLADDIDGPLDGLDCYGSL